MDTVESLPSRIPATEEWDAAYQRVESYLHALQIRNRPALNRLVQRILEASLERIQNGEQGSPAEVAGKEMIHALAGWFRQVLELGDNESDDDVLLRGRMALIMSSLPPERQALILADDVHDQDFLSELRRAYQLSGPNFERVTMKARPLDLSAPARVADQALRGLDRRPRMRFILVWLLVLGLFGFIFYNTR